MSATAPTVVQVHVNPASMMADSFAPDRVRDAAGDLSGARLGFSRTPEALEAALPEAEVLLLTGQADLSDLRRRAPRLRWVSYTSAGVDWLIGAGLPEEVVLTNASGTHAPKAAEFALTAVLMLNAGIPRLATAGREGRWAPRGGGTVAGKTVLILGMGALGGAAAEALARQGLRVVGNSRSGRPHPAVAVMTRGEGFREHLPEADFLLITLPLTAETRGAVGRAELDRLPPRAGVINIGRGEVLDHAALAAKLEEGSLAGAVLDALPQEPLPPDSPLWAVPNLLITSHCGVYDPEAYGPRCLGAFFANLRRWRTGAALEQVVDRRAGY